jgi:DNA-binding response OmpR family regulator
MEERLRRIEEEVRQIERREDRKAQNLTVPVDLWLDSGSVEEGGILIIQRNANVRRRLANMLRRRGYKVRPVEGGRQALSAFRQASYSLMIIHWGIFQRSSDLVGLLRKAFPQTRIIITSPNFAWPSENAAGAQRGMEALEAGAYCYIPQKHIRRNILTCVEAALVSTEKACPVLISGRACNLQCTD